MLSTIGMNAYDCIETIISDDTIDKKLKHLLDYLQLHARSKENDARR